MNSEIILNFISDYGFYLLGLIGTVGATVLPVLVPLSPLTPKNRPFLYLWVGSIILMFVWGGVSISELKSLKTDNGHLSEDNTKLIEDNKRFIDFFSCLSPDCYKFANKKYNQKQINSSDVLKKIHQMVGSPDSINGDLMGKMK